MLCVSEREKELAAKIEADGFAIVENLIDDAARSLLLDNLHAGQINMRGGAGLRNMMNAVPATRALAGSAALLAHVEPVLGAPARVVRGILFDKTPDANWKVAWHQDLTIAVRQKIETPGFTSWSIKAGITHVQPPVAVLEQMLTLRVHLDDTDEDNGALRVLPGSHKHGRLSAQEIETWRKQCAPTVCAIPQGGLMMMRPLLLHASSQAVRPRHRRVLHFEYATADLPEGLEWHEN